MATLDRLITLQNLVKRDPSSYIDEFRLQLKNFHAELDILRLGATGAVAGGANAVSFGHGSTAGKEDFKALTMFLAHVAVCFPSEMSAFPQTLLTLLDRHADAMDGEIRRTLVQALILLRNKGLTPALPLLKAFFAMFRVRDKALREMLFSHIVADIRGLGEGKAFKGQVSGSGSSGGGSGGGSTSGSAHSTKVKKTAGVVGPVPVALGAAEGAVAASTVSRAVQAHLYSLVSDTAPPVAAKKSLDVMIELYRKRVWTDARTVNVIAQALTSSKPKLLVTAVKFFLNLDPAGLSVGGGDDEDDDDEEDGEAGKPKVNVDPKAVKQLEYEMQHAKKTRKKIKQLHKQLAGLKRARSKAGATAQPVFPAIQLLHDPQTVAEKMLAALRKSTHRFEVRLLCLNLITRVVGTHRLLVLPLYSFIQRYLAAHQAHVTQVLAYLLQSVHDLVPPDEVAPIVRALANNFISDAAGPELIQVGMNSLREIISRCPAVLEEEGMGDLMGDLVLYRKNGSRGVVAASRAILNLVREWYPALLKRRDRGRDVAMDESLAAARPSAYGSRNVATGVEGSELLALSLAHKARKAEHLLEGDDDEDLDDDEVMSSRPASDGPTVGSNAARSATSSLDPTAFGQVADADEWRRAQLSRVKQLREAGKGKAAKLLLDAIRGAGAARGLTAGAISAGKQGMRLSKSGRAANHSADVAEDEEADELVELLAGADDEEEHEDEAGNAGHVHGPGCAHGIEEEEDDDDEEDDDEEDDDEEDDDEEDYDEEDDDEDDEDDEDEDDDKEDEEDDDEEEEDNDDDEDAASHGPHSGGASHGHASSGHASSSVKASARADLAAALGPLLANGKASSMQLEVGGKRKREFEDGKGRSSESAMAHQLEGDRIFTPKDYARIRSLQGKLAERGLHVSKGSQVMALLRRGTEGYDAKGKAIGRAAAVEHGDGDEDEGGHADFSADVEPAAKRRKGTVSDAEWERRRAKRTRKSGRGLGLAKGSDEEEGGEDEGVDSGDESDNQLAMPGVSFAPPVSSYDPMSIEALETTHKRKQAERLVDTLKDKQRKGKFEGKKKGGGTTNTEKRRMKNFVMLRNSGSVASKLKRSLKESNRVLKGRIKGQKTMEKRQKQKRRRT